MWVKALWARFGGGCYLLSCFLLVTYVFILLWYIVVFLR